MMGLTRGINQNRNIESALVVACSRTTLWKQKFMYLQRKAKQLQTQKEHYIIQANPIIPNMLFKNPHNQHHTKALKTFTRAHMILSFSLI